MFLRIFTAVICLVLTCFIPGKIIAQKKAAADYDIVVSDTTDIDALFKRARNLAYNKEYAQSRKILMAILENRSDYYDVRSFLGRTFAWEGLYNEARTEFSKVLIEKPDFSDALDALIDVEIWTEQYTVANEYIKIALGYYPTSEQFLMKKVKVSLRQQDKLTASLTLRKILEINPGNKEALKMLNETGGIKLNNHIQLGYVADFFDKQNEPQQQFFLEFGKNFRPGSFNLRVNYAERFARKSFQGEVDAYLHFIKGNYVYLNAGYSQSSIFPKYRLGGDIFQKLPAGFEISAGARYLKFPKGSTFSFIYNDTEVSGSSSSSTLIYTAYIGNYFRDYWFAVRAYVTPKSLEGDEAVYRTYSKSFLLTIRKYLDDADNYFGVRGGMGQNPDSKYIMELRNSYSGAFEFQRAAFGRWLIKGEVGYSREEPRADFILQHYVINISLKNIF